MCSRVGMGATGWAGQAAPSGDVGRVKGGMGLCQGKGKPTDSKMPSP